MFVQAAAHFEGLPDQILVISVKSGNGLHLLQAAFACACASTAIWSLTVVDTTLVTGWRRCWRLRKKETTDSNSFPSTSSDVHCKTKTAGLGDWLIAIALMVPVLALTHNAFETDARAVILSGRHNDDANGLVYTMAAAGAMGESTEVLDDDTAALGCGPVGMAVRAVAADIFDTIQVIYTNETSLFVVLLITNGAG